MPMAEERPEKILVVDDDEEWLEICALSLRKLGFKVESAPNGKKALEMIAEKEFDIVLTDLMMPPPYGGKEVTAGIKARRPETDVILMTASPSMKSAIEVLKEGAYDYIIKPFGFDYLKSVFDRCCEKRRSQKELVVEKQLREELTAAYADLKKTEKLKEAFLARISHELNTPLMRMSLAISLLEESVRWDDEKQRSHMDGAVEGFERLREVIQDLLSFVDVQKPDLEIKLEPVAFADIVKEITYETRRLAESKQLSISTELPDDLPNISGDKALLKRAFRHLLLNAINFNNDGGAVRISAKSRGTSISLKISNDGEGVPLDKKKRIFDPFYQVAEYLTRKVGGIGIGLAITKKIVEAHHGTISVASEPGKGTEFSVSLPLNGKK